MSRLRLGFLVLAWSIGAAIGIGSILRFELTPAPRANSATDWPTASQLTRDRSRPTAVMFIHPHCPCSRASLAELRSLASRCRGRVDLQVVMVKPPGVEDDWERTDLFAGAAKIPGVTIHSDRDGREAILFGAATSGEMMLFDREGRRTFNGGITVSRGHEGENAGLSAITALIGTGHTDVDATPVYGCSLLNQCDSVEDPKHQTNP